MTPFSLSSFVVVLDACVLAPPSLRDLLLRAATEELYTSYWSAQALGELYRTLQRLPGWDRRRAEAICRDLRDEFPEATISSTGVTIPGLTTDPDDQHVVVAAILSRAGMIATSNERHFPQPVLDEFQIQIQTPDEFLCDLFELAPRTLVDIVVAQSARLQRPPMTAIQLADDKLRRHCPDFVDLILPQLPSD